jgi:DNA-binding transcriptional regulator YiaG
VTAAQFRAAIDRLGLNQLEAAHLLRVDGRTVRRWIAGDREIPGPAIAFLELLEGCPTALRYVRRHHVRQ